MLIDSGSLHFADERWEATGDLADLDVPPTIQALLAARLDLLGREERAVIEPAAVIGLSFAEAAVTELAPEPVRAKVPDHLSRHDAQAAGAVDPGRQPGGARLPLPAHPHPRRRLQRAPQAGASRPSTSGSSSGRTS